MDTTITLQDCSEYAVVDGRYKKVAELGEVFIGINRIDAFSIGPNGRVVIVLNSGVRLEGKNTNTDEIMFGSNWPNI